MTDDLEALKAWVGKTEIFEERVSAGRVQGLAALLDKPDIPRDGDLMRPMDHWCFFKPRVRQSEIGPDGHPKRGDFMPPVPLPRRVFGGFRAVYHQPLRLGEMARKEAKIIAVAIKQGRDGPLVICTVSNRFSGENGLAIEEEHDFIYRGDPPAKTTKTPETKPSAAPPPAFDYSQVITPDPVMLFRYSACTFNGHRIHYDYKYVTEVEGYPGLIVHGPLIATFLMELAMGNNPDKTPTGYTFQARAPLFGHETFTVAGKTIGDGCETWSLRPDGQVSATGVVKFQ
ncbi:MAG: MaoC family dehydratase N-terminal domain-containing protein [Alphaproteobacteria bacterium]|nr:MaoC family dehydratase N-terminal domain-containing protein [Alphaproteobacteria bacterium]